MCDCVISTPALTTWQDKPEKPVPQWAKGQALKTALYTQFTDGTNPEHIFPHAVSPPDLTRIFPRAPAKSKIKLVVVKVDASLTVAQVLAAHVVGGVGALAVTPRHAAAQILVHPHAMTGLMCT